MEFNLKDFISTERKIDLIGLTIEESHIDGIINPMVVDILFSINLILIYTSIDVSMEEKADKFALYDKFMAENVFDDFVYKMNEKYPGELEMLKENLNKWIQETRIYINSINGIIDNLKIFVNDIAEKIGENLQALENVDLEQLSQLIPLAKQFGIDFQKKEIEGN